MHRAVRCWVGWGPGWFYRADDVTLFVSNKQDLEHSLNIIKTFSQFSNLEIKKNKTEMMWLGSKRNCTEEVGGVMCKDKLKSVWITFSNSNPASSLEENWNERIAKMHSLIKTVVEMKPEYIRQNMCN